MERGRESAARITKPLTERERGPRSGRLTPQFGKVAQYVCIITLFGAVTVGVVKLTR